MILRCHKRAEIPIVQNPAMPSAPVQMHLNMSCAPAENVDLVINRQIVIVADERLDE